ncbi:MAG TPA: hypothetical protein VFS35_01470 [Terrimicrobiaceae bacterium]|nr:hypothetical protein [Terrimicrobiaceae bacterium]
MAHPPPVSGKLPFAPRFARFYESSLGPLLVEGGGFGYAFSGVAPPAKAVRLDWRIETRVLELDGSGRTKSVVADRKQIVRTVHNMANLDFSVRLPKRSALYRYVIEFSRLDGETLGDYSEYVRVLPRRVHAVLRADAATVSPGGIVRNQVANFGTVPVSYGAGVDVEFFDGVKWSPATMFQHPRVEKSARVLPAGEASPCEALEVPGNAPPGHYRAVKGVSPLLGDDRRIMSRFQVVPAK